MEVETIEAVAQVSEVAGATPTLAQRLADFWNTDVEEYERKVGVRIDHMLTKGAVYRSDLVPEQGTVLGPYIQPKLTDI